MARRRIPHAESIQQGARDVHGLFEFALRREWCEKNVVKLVGRKKVVEREIKPLRLAEVQRILDAVKRREYRDCAAAVGILVWAGMRPCEVRRLKWRDINLDENVITVRSVCSKTGGVRQVEICPALKNWLTSGTGELYADENGIETSARNA